MLEHRLAKLSAACAFLLLIIGGTVNPTGSSLACPESFLICHGSLFPRLTGGVLFEHGHRLVAMSVGLLQIALSVMLWLRRPALRRWAIAGFLMVCAQGALGAITVKFKLPWFVSTAHLTLAMVYLATLVYVSFRTRPAPATPRALPAARRLIAIGGGLVFAQIVLGGLVRHHGAALASIDLPLDHGHLWPAGPLALKLHMAHRIFGVVAGLGATVCAILTYRRARDHRGIRLAALAVPVVVVAQIALGAWIILSFRAVPVVVAHFAGAATLWCLWLGMWFAAGGRAPAAEARRASDPSLSAAVAS